MAITKRKKRRTPINYRRKQNLNFFGSVAIISALGFATWWTVRYIKKSLPADPLNWYTLLQPGMQGQEIKVLQDSLNGILKWNCALYSDSNFGPGGWNSYGIEKIPITGKFDADTIKGIKALQEHGFFGGPSAPNQKVQLISVVEEENTLPDLMGRTCPY